MTLSADELKLHIENGVARWLTHVESVLMHYADPDTYVRRNRGNGRGGTVRCSLIEVDLGDMARKAQMILEAMRDSLLLAGIDPYEGEVHTLPEYMRVQQDIIQHARLYVLYGRACDHVRLTHALLAAGMLPEPVARTNPEETDGCGA